jgi:eukaryotic-like serine/threonine-protein kinase
MEADATLVQDQTEVARAAELSRQLEAAPARVPGYALVRSLGDGAYGSVWLAFEENTGKQVAIKFYTHHRGLDWSLLNREVEKLAVLYTSRNIVRLIDVGWNSEPPYYVMEYLAHGSLASFLTAGPLPPQEAVRIAKSVLLALVHAHGSGILHCDLKPANVLLDNDFEPRLCDFGQSRLSNEQNPALGTVFYMAPEQADLQAVPDARWDVYALGALLYHMLCGDPPYRTPELEEAIKAAPTLETKLAIYRQRIRSSPKPLGLRSRPGIDRRLAEIVERCLQVDPEKRYPNAQAVLDTLVLRDRSRARRPLITLGIVGPALLLLAMAWLVVQLLDTTGTDASVTMIRRALESDTLSARIVAQSLNRDLDERERELSDLAKRIVEEKWLEPVKAALTKPAITNETANQEVFKSLNNLRKRSDQRSASLGLQKDFSWFLTDAAGIQKWRSPFQEPGSNVMTIGQSYAYREYFNGRSQHENSAGSSKFEPIQQPHITHRFVGPNGSYLVAMSVPIWDAEHTHVIGVLGRSIEIGSLLDEYGRAIFEEASPARRHTKVSREIALLERVDGNLLDHTWFDKNDALVKSHPLTTAKLDSLQVSERLRQKLERLSASDGSTARRDFVDDEHYVDPLSQFEPAAADLAGEWLAAFAAVPETNWVTVVQERRSAALEPVQEMKTRLTHDGWWALLASCGLIGVLWYFVGRALNDRTPRLWAPGYGRRRSDTLESGMRTADKTARVGAKNE